MSAGRTKPRGQFSLRSLLAGTTWLALLLAICVGHQRAAHHQRIQLEAIKASGQLPPARFPSGMKSTAPGKSTLHARRARPEL